MDSPLPIFIGFFVLAVALAIFGAIQAKKRRDALAKLAARLGLRFASGRDYGLAERFGFLNRLCSGSNRYAENVLNGAFEGETVFIFDYHYETHSHSSKGGRRTHHHHLGCFVLLLPGAFPELTVTREGFFSKIAQAIGYDDIDFESHEFSKTFCVRSRDKKFAYDICHARMMEYMLENRDLSLEIEHNALALMFSGRVGLNKIEPNLRRLLALRRLMPEYLFNPR